MPGGFDPLFLKKDGSKRHNLPGEKAQVSRGNSPEKEGSQHSQHLEDGYPGQIKCIQAGCQEYALHPPKQIADPTTSPWPYNQYSDSCHCFSPVRLRCLLTAIHPSMQEDPYLIVFTQQPKWSSSHSQFKTPKHLYLIMRIKFKILARLTGFGYYLPWVIGPLVTVLQPHIGFFCFWIPYISPTLQLLYILFFFLVGVFSLHSA